MSIKTFKKETFFILEKVLIGVINLSYFHLLYEKKDSDRYNNF